MKNKVNVAIFARVSTNVQDYESQIYQLKELAKRNGWNVIKIYSEIVSGYADDSNRSQFIEMLDDLKSGKLKVEKVLVEEISRLGRKPLQIKQVVQDLNKLKISIFARNIGLETLKSDGTEDLFSNFVITIMIELGNLEREVLMNRIKRGLLNKAMLGNVGGGIFQPYGYQKGDDKKLIINETEAKIVKHIFSLCINNKWGSQRIAKELNLLEIPTKYNLSGKKEPIKYKFGQVDIKDFRWAPTVVLNILKNPIYKGERRFKENTLEAPTIIEPSIWENAQIQINRNKNDNPRKSKHQYLLKDILKCGRCRHNFFGKKRSDLKDNYYMCSSRRIKTFGCNNRGIGIDKIEKIIWNLLKFYPDIVNFIKTKSKSNIDNKSQLALLEKRVLALNKNINLLSQQLQRAIDLTLKYDVKELQLQFENKIIEIQNNIQTSQIDLRESKFKIIELKERISFETSANSSLQLLNHISSFDQKLEILNYSIDKVSVLYLDNINCHQLTIIFKNGRALFLFIPIQMKNSLIDTKVYFENTRKNKTFFYPILVTKLPEDPTVLDSYDNLINEMKKDPSPFGQIAILSDDKISYFGKGKGKISLNFFDTLISNPPHVL